MSFTNAQLAQKIADLIEYWSDFNKEYSDWQGGAVGGGPGNDGRYPLTDWFGNELLVRSPAQLEDDVDDLVTGAQGYANAAAASAAAALTSENNASTSESNALSHANDADADRIAAAGHETNATNASVTATTQANLAATRAAAALVSETNAATSETNAAASEAAAAASAAAAATFDPALFMKLDGTQAMTGTLQGVAATFSGAVTGSNLNVSNWDTAYGWGNHASVGYAQLSGATFTGALVASGQAQPFQIKGGALDHVYMAWFADAAAQGTRSAYMGFPSAGSDTLTIENQQGDTLSVLNKLTASDRVQATNFNATAIGGFASYSGASYISMYHDGTDGRVNAQHGKLRLTRGGSTKIEIDASVTYSFNPIDMGTNVITDTAVGQWITAYGWGDHASAGYAVADAAESFDSLALHPDTTVDSWGLRLESSNNPVNDSGFWSTGNAWRLLLRDSAGNIDVDLNPGGTSVFTNAVTFSSAITVQGEAVNSSVIGNWNTAHGWGDHASGGYFKADGSVTATGNWQGGGYRTINYHAHWITAANGNGIGFWNGAPSTYGIYMSSAADGTYGGRADGETTSDYNMYFEMNDGTNRGFVFETDNVKLFSINPSGIYAPGNVYVGGETADTAELVVSGGEGFLGRLVASEGIAGSYGGSLTYDGGANIVSLRRHDNSTDGTVVMSFPRTSNDVTFSGDIAAANIPAYNSFTGGAIVTRHSSGYIFTNYLNMAANTTTSAATKVAVETSSDGYLRWQAPSVLMAKVGAMYAEEMTSSVNLNNLVAANAGFYYQTSNADTTGNNYPNGHAGSLIVQKSAGNATQLYITYPTSSNKMFFRSNYNAGWSSWQEVITAAVTQTISGAKTFSSNPKRSSQGGYVHHNSSSYTDGGITFSTSSASGGTTGDIWFKYT